MKYPGAQHMRFLIRVALGVRKLKFQYYFESFGEVAVPVPAAAARPK